MAHDHQHDYALDSQPMALGHVGHHHLLFILFSLSMILSQPTLDLFLPDTQVMIIHELYCFS